MKIMHCADFHLDSSFSGLDSGAADARRAELRESLVSVIKYAKEAGVQLILISGDLFDRPYCTASTKHEVFEALASAECPIVISPGNHDPYIKGGVYADKGLPENVFVFSSTELGRFDFDEIGVSVFGYAYTSDSYEKDPISDSVPLSETNINVLCAHSDVRSAFSKYAPMTASGISRAGFTYAALGHVHLAPKPQRIGNCTMAYSGFVQGRSFDETGEGGVYVVDIDRETLAVTLERVVFSKLRYEIERLDITGCERDTEVISRITKLITDKRYGKNTALRVILEGAVLSAYTPSQKRICAGGALSALALLEIKDETSPTLDLDYLEKDITVRGEFYKSLKPMLTSDDESERECAKLALKAGLAALDRRELSLGLASDGE